MLILYIGSSIGNFEPMRAAALLARVRRTMQPADRMLLGIDLAKAPEVLLPAYDDAQGVTAAFNKNILRRINRELAADFDLDRFRHRAVWNQAESRDRDAPGEHGRAASLVRQFVPRLLFRSRRIHSHGEQL